MYCIILVAGSLGVGQEPRGNNLMIFSLDLAVTKGRESREESQGDWCGPCAAGAGGREICKQAQKLKPNGCESSITFCLRQEAFLPWMAEQVAIPIARCPTTIFE